MNSSQSSNQFVPRQALSPTPQLYDELVGDTMETLAKASLACMSPILSGAVIHDNGCGTGAATAAVVDSIVGSQAKVSIKGTDINNNALHIYKSHATDKNWPAEALKMDSQRLSFSDDTFTHSINNALLFVLPNDGIDALKETYRTLKPGGTAIANSWAYVPNMKPLHTASKVTRPPGTPLPRQGNEKWAQADFLKEVMIQGGFKLENITLTTSDIYCTVPELTHFATMMWSFIGGTSEVGWLKSDEDSWATAIEIIKEELRKTKGFKELEGGRAQLKFVANILVAIK